MDSSMWSESNITSLASHKKQVVKVILHKAALPLHMDGSIVLARLSQCAPHLVHVNWHPHCTRAAPCRVTLSISTATRLGMSCAGTFSPSKIAPSCVGIWTPSNTWFLGPAKSTSQTASGLVQLLLYRQTNRQTDRPCYSVCSNRPHLASAALQPNKYTMVSGLDPP